MMAVLLLLSLLVGPTALALPGEPPECLQGPEFWCRDMATAAQCGQLQFCLEYDWNELPEGADERHPLVKCWACKKVISKLKKMVSNTHNTSSVAMAIKKICSKFRSGFAAKCHRVVDRYMQPIEDGLAQDLEPRDICVSINMCKSQGHPALAGSPLAQQGCAEGPTFWCRSLATAVRCGAVQICAQAGWNQAAKEDMCADCGQIITILTRMAKDSAFKEGIQKYLTHECTLLPLHTLVPHCQKVVDTYFTLFIACLEGQIKPTSICGSLGLCPTDPSQDQSQDKCVLQLLQGLHLYLPDGQTQGGHSKDLPFPLPLCWMCRSFVGRIESTIPKGAIAKSMSQLCHLLPGTIGGMCQCLMEKYTTTVLDLILDKLGPRLICGMLLMCTTGENCSPDPPLVPLLAQSAECQACVAVLGLAKSAVQANSTVADVEVALVRACSGAHQGWQECKSFMEQHWPQLLTLLPKAWDPQSTCQELGACEAGTGPAPGPEGCMLGPAYWCSSLETAKQCQAVQHCQAHSWA
ncbi:hypothetical protein KIL84_011269 [Mauremys mutica]|uniref:Pulmonary surfactant-associated protein B n=1 Tax=Mauremys mutica TaxID=74926 RepID=A0A9D4AV73_9SAUR|nr:hypothetical protein KIL84_011269 [Mauremys mutica]